MSNSYGDLLTSAQNEELALQKAGSKSRGIDEDTLEVFHEDRLQSLDFIGLILLRHLVQALL
jgi:hypothetical protein